MVERKKETVEIIAESLIGVFEDFEKRSLAVSDVIVTKENIPNKFPTAMTMLDVEEGDHGYKSGNLNLSQNMLTEMWFENDTHKTTEGEETAFWNYFPYEEVRDKFLKHLFSIEDKIGMVEYTQLDLEVLEYAVVISIRYKIHKYAHDVHCDDEEEPKIKSVSFSFCKGTSTCKT